MNLRIIIFTEEIAGNGHTKAAETIGEVCKNQYIDADVQIVTIFSLFNKHFERMISHIYFLMIKNVPSLWRILHNKESRFSILSKKLIAYFIKPKLNRFLKNQNVQLIITTHASGLEALSLLKLKYNFTLATVFTDFQVNSYWICTGIDNYFVPHQEQKDLLISKYNIKSEKIIVSGIPISSNFSKQIEYMKSNSNFNILIMGGSLGLGKIKEIIISLDKIKVIPLSLTVVTGKNTVLYEELLKLKSQIEISLLVYGYCEQVYKLMKESDLLISKPGGLTISEALAVQLPLLIYKPIPGQEEHNANFLIKNNAAIRIDNFDKLTYWVEYLYNNPQFCKDMKYQQKKLAKPNSAHDIAKKIIH